VLPWSSCEYLWFSKRNVTLTSYSDRPWCREQTDHPAEGGGGKIKLLNAGAYTNVDISLIAHPGISPDAALVRTAAYFAFKAEYFGKEAHAAARPWEGINALDALITAYNAYRCSGNRPSRAISFKG